MTVLDVISVFDENKKCILMDVDGDILSVYDGKNSIDELYNNREIVQISVEDDTIELYGQLLGNK